MFPWAGRTPEIREVQMKADFVRPPPAVLPPVTAPTAIPQNGPCPNIGQVPINEAFRMDAVEWSYKRPLSALVDKTAAGPPAAVLHVISACHCAVRSNSGSLTTRQEDSSVRARSYLAHVTRCRSADSYECGNQPGLQST